MSEDILAAIDSVIEDWEVGPDAARFGAPGDVQEAQIAANEGRYGPPVFDHRVDALVYALPGLARGPVLSAQVLVSMTESIREVGRSMARAMQGFVEAVTRMWEVLTGGCRDVRAAHGDQIDRRSGVWVSQVCAAWVHERCPLPSLCGCTSKACGHRKPDDFEDPLRARPRISVREPLFARAPAPDWSGDRLAYAVYGAYRPRFVTGVTL